MSVKPAAQYVRIAEHRAYITAGSIRRSTLTEQENETKHLFNRDETGYLQYYTSVFQEQSGRVWKFTNNPITLRDQTPILFT